MSDELPIDVAAFAAEQEGVLMVPFGVCAAGSCEFCGCTFRRPSDVMNHRCAAMQEAGPLLQARLEAEAANPRAESIVRAERAIVRALVAGGFGRQHQVTHQDRFEIAVDDLLIRVEVQP